MDYNIYNDYSDRTLPRCIHKCIYITILTITLLVSIWMNFMIHYHFDFLTLIRGPELLF